MLQGWPVVTCFTDSMLFTNNQSSSFIFRLNAFHELQSIGKIKDHTALDEEQPYNFQVVQKIFSTYSFDALIRDCSCISGRSQRSMPNQLPHIYLSALMKSSHYSTMTVFLEVKHSTFLSFQDIKLKTLTSKS